MKNTKQNDRNKSKYFSIIINVKRLNLAIKGCPKTQMNEKNKFNI